PATKWAMSIASCTSPPASTSTLPASRLTRVVMASLSRAVTAGAAGRHPAPAPGPVALGGGGPSPPPGGVARPVGGVLADNVVGMCGIHRSERVHGPPGVPGRAASHTFQDWHRPYQPCRESSRSAAARDGEPVERREHHRVDAIVSGHPVVERPDGPDVLVRVVSDHPAGPQDVVGEQHATGTHAGHKLVP